MGQPYDYARLDEPMGALAGANTSYAEDTEVEVRYPLTQEQKRGPRDAWPWLAGVVTEVCGPDEWQVCVEDERTASFHDGEAWYPLAFRDSSEIRPR